MRIDYQPIPERYFEEANKPGAIRKIEYHSARSGDKHAFVYVPFSYDDANPDIRYDILYLMHGAGCSAATYFGSDAAPNRYKNVLDNMIAAREMRPLLIVTPTFYPASVTDYTIENTGPLTERFPEELANELIPAVENTFHSYANATDHDGLKASRSRRSFGGFSMGGVTTWYVFLRYLDYFSGFLPESGGCWAIGPMGGGAAPEATARTLADAVRGQGYTSSDFQIYAATGTKDMAYRPLFRQIDAMKQLTDVFQYSETTTSGNLHYILAEGQPHTCDAAAVYLYDVLKMMYPCITLRSLQ